MKLPIQWLLDYLPGELRGPGFADALRQACARWELAPADDAAQMLGRLMTFAGFACDKVNGAGLDATLDLDVLSNRPDGQCIVGLAREIAVILQQPLLTPSCDVREKESGEPAEKLASVRIDEPDLCPRYTARIIRGVKVGPSPKWLQERLEWMGLQPRNNIVDVTNFVCFELNQPLHAFDLKTLEGRQIIVRRAQEKEPFTPLYGETPPLTPETLVIADGQHARAVAGVIGGKGAEVTSDTTDILLEAAYFNPASTRRAVRRLKVMEGRGTDASYRFERGIDLENVANASARAAKLIVEIAGGTVAPGIIDVWPRQRTAKTIALRYAELERVFGAPVRKEETRRILVCLGCQVTTEAPAQLTLQAPTWRRGDLEHEIDLIEEVARLYGYNHVPDTTAMSARVPPRPAWQSAGENVRTLLTALGYFEAVSDSLIDPKWPAPAVWTREAPLPLDKASVLSEDHSALRNSLLASLLSVRRFNQDRRSGEARMFELGKVFLPVSGSRPEERVVLALLDDRGFQALADTVSRIGSGLEQDGAHLKLSAPISTADFLASGQGCQVLRVREMAGDERAQDVVGWVGMISPALQKAFDLRNPVAVCELDWSKIVVLPSAPLRYQRPPAFPEIVRDIAMVAEEKVTWADIESFARGWAAHEPLRDKAQPPRFMSVFRGKQIGAGKKSVAFSLVYRAADRTLTDEEVNAAHARFQQAVLERFKATLRV
ncbi:MAG TPA: phenylalanine--tRNA ligase subunit beta [Planctomycetota bacterium]|jgi:phenylalanyl-tRNA synthetase beta chain